MPESTLDIKLKILDNNEADKELDSSSPNTTTAAMTAVCGPQVDTTTMATGQAQELVGELGTDQMNKLVCPVSHEGGNVEEEEVKGELNTSSVGTSPGGVAASGKLLGNSSGTTTTVKPPPSTKQSQTTLSVLHNPPASVSHVPQEVDFRSSVETQPCVPVIGEAGATVEHRHHTSSGTGQVVSQQDGGAGSRPAAGGETSSSTATCATADDILLTYGDDNDCDTSLELTRDLDYHPGEEGEEEEDGEVAPRLNGNVAVVAADDSFSTADDDERAGSVASVLFRAGSPGLVSSTPRVRPPPGPDDCSGGVFSHSQTFSNSLSQPKSLFSAADHPVERQVVPDSASTPSQDGPLSLPNLASGSKSYDYLLKVLLVGDSDVGKQEIITGMEEGSQDSPYCSSTGAAYKTTIILIDGKKVKLHIWDTSGQGRFCTIIRSYSRGAQGILLVYDITNRWSFEGIDRWLREVEEHAPGIPKVLVGNRLHLAFKRQVDPLEAEAYAERNNMGFYEISPLVNFNITESFQELCRMALKRNGMERLWRSNKVLTLHELCCHSIVARTNVYGIDRLPLPDAIKVNLKSYALATPSHHSQSFSQHHRQNYKSMKEKRKKAGRPPDASSTKCVNVSRKSCAIS